MSRIMGSLNPDEIRRDNSTRAGDMIHVGVGVYIDGLEMPVIPSEIKYKLPDDSERFVVLGLGDVEILQGVKLSEVLISGIFPSFGAHFVVDGFLQPEEYITKIEKLIAEKTPVRFVYTGVTCDINMQVSLHDFELEEKGGDVGTWHYSLTIRKWVDPKAKRVELSTKPGATAGGQPRTQTPAEKPIAGGGMYTVKDGDTLSGIAKALLGDSSRWPEIYELNKSTIKNPNYITPGMTLKMPEGTASSAAQKASAAKADKKASASSVPKQSQGSSSKHASSKPSGSSSSSKSKTTATGAPAPKYASAKNLETRYTVPTLPAGMHHEASTTTRVATGAKYTQTGVRDYAGLISGKSSTATDKVRAQSSAYDKRAQEARDTAYKPYKVTVGATPKSKQEAVVASQKSRSGYTYSGYGGYNWGAK